MLALVGEQNVRLFPARSELASPHSVDSEDFFENYSRNTSAIILDLTCVDFYLDHVRDTFIFEALKSLKCKRKILAPNEKADIVKKEGFSLFSKSDFYIQNVSINDLRLFRRISKIPQIIDVFLIEQAICELCKSITKIDDKTWWLYVAKHKSGYAKITAGIGNGIAYSRSFFEIEQTDQKIQETIKFLTRDGLDKNLKIISFVDDISIPNFEIISPTIPPSDIEITLADIISNKTKNYPAITPQFSKDNNFRRFLALKYSAISGILIILILTFCSFIWHYYNTSADLKNAIQIEKDKLNIFVKDSSKNISMRIQQDNFNSIKTFIEIAEKFQNPIDLMQKISRTILKEKRIDKLQIERENEEIVARFKTVLSSEDLKPLSAIADIPESRISLKVLDTSTLNHPTENSSQIYWDTEDREYTKNNNDGNNTNDNEDDLPKSPKYEVEICVKMN